MVGFCSDPAPKFGVRRCRGHAAGVHARRRTGAFAAQRQLHHRRPPRHAGSHAHGTRDPGLDQHHAAHRRANCSFTCTTTPGATPTRPGCASTSSRRGGRRLRARDPRSLQPSMSRASELTGGALAPADLTRQMRFIAPDDGNADDRTVMAVTLPAAVGPGQTITLDIAWTAKIPRPFARTGAIGNYFFLGQWFPKIGVLDPDGPMELPSVSRRNGVLRRLRRLRRPHDRAARLAARRHGPRARAHGQRRRHDDASLLPGRRPRLRVDDESRLRGAARALRAPGPAAGRDAPDAAARACLAGRPPLREHARGAAAVRRMVRRRIPTATSPSSIPPGEARPTAWSIRRCLPSAPRG